MNLFKKSRNNNLGQALVETLAAVAVAAIVIIALLNLGISSMRGAGSSKDEAEALRLAYEEVELVRTFRDNEGFFELASYYNLCGATSDECSISSAGEVVTGLETVGMYQRHFYMTYTEGEGILDIFVTVKWTDSGKERKVETATKFSEWYKKIN